MRMTTPGRTIPQPQHGRPGKGRVGQHAGPVAPKRRDTRHHGAHGKGAGPGPRSGRPAKGGG